MGQSRPGELHNWEKISGSKNLDLKPLAAKKEKAPQAAEPFPISR